MLWSNHFDDGHESTFLCIVAKEKGFAHCVSIGLDEIADEALWIALEIETEYQVSALSASIWVRSFGAILIKFRVSKPAPKVMNYFIVVKLLHRN